MAKCSKLWLDYSTTVETDGCSVQIFGRAGQNKPPLHRYCVQSPPCKRWPGLSGLQFFRWMYFPSVLVCSPSDLFPVFPAQRSKTLFCPFSPFQPSAFVSCGYFISWIPLSFPVTKLSQGFSDSPKSFLSLTIFSRSGILRMMQCANRRDTMMMMMIMKKILFCYNTALSRTLVHSI